MREKITYILKSQEQETLNISHNIFIGLRQINYNFSCSSDITFFFCKKTFRISLLLNDISTFVNINIFPTRTPSAYQLTFRIVLHDV